MAQRAHIATLIGVTFPGQPVETPAKKAPSKGAQIVGGLVALALSFACIGGIAKAGFGGSSSKPAGNATPADRSLEAKAICETFVKRQLKAPATAKFSEESSAKVTDVEYTAGGSVDSQNSFGALLRSTFACDMTYDAAKQEWTSKSVSVVPA